MYILGISGYKKSGKDSVAKILMNHLQPKHTVRIGFADALKEEIAVAIKQPVSYIEEHKDNFRLILQGWGSDFRRNLHGNDYWVEKWLHKLNGLPSSTYAVLVPDVRFPNEAKTILKVGGTIWRVTRNGVMSDGHESEEQINNLPFARQIENTWTLEALESLVIKAWKTDYAHTT